MSSAPVGRIRVSGRDVLADAAAGVLPSWAVATELRIAHIHRVAALMDEWARNLGLDAHASDRWRAAAVLHDALRDEMPERLRTELPAPFRDWPGSLLHGPAAAHRLAADGVEDHELLAAVRFHTTGHADFGDLGRALFCADWLDPVRSILPGMRASMRARMPDDLHVIVREILAARIAHLIEVRSPIQPESLGFWNRLVEESRGPAH